MLHFAAMGLSDEKTLGKNSLIIHECAKLGNFFVKKSHLELWRRELRGTLCIFGPLDARGCMTSFVSLLRGAIVTK